jgi:hypothetical protein
MKRTFLLALALLSFAVPAAAEAGIYHVYTCAAGGRAYANNAWKVSADVDGITEDADCAGGLGLIAPQNARTPNNQYTTLAFTSPVGTSIADFALTRQIGYTNLTAPETHRYYLLYTLGSTHFAGGGDCCNPTRDALNAQRSWYGYEQENFNISRSSVGMRSFPALGAYRGDARSLALRLGCYNRGTPCSVAGGGGAGVSHLLHGADITINDAVAPSVTVEASGLLDGAPRHGSDPVTVSASDGAGIRRVEILDHTHGETVVGVEDYAEVPTDTNRLCDYSQPAPCPGLSRETVRATSLPAGDRLLTVRVTDTGGNVVQRGPYAVTVLTPSDRGAFNGIGATDTGTLDVRWTKGSKRSRTLRYGARAGIRGRLLNASGGPVSGARVTLLTRDLRREAPLVQRVTLLTGQDGSFRTTVSATASRMLQFSWLSHVNDVRFTSNAYLTLRARASARLAVSTRRPRVGRRFTLSGRLRGVSRSGVTVILQGRARGSRRWETFADTVSTRSGRFRARYRFRSSASKGRRFVFRARIRPSSRFPYSTGYSPTVTVRVG